MLVLVSELLVLTMSLAASGIRGFAWESFALTSLFVLWVVLSSAALLCAARQWLNQHSVVVVALLAILLVASVTTLFTFLSNWLLQAMMGVTAHWQLLDDLLRNVLVSLVMAGMLLRYFYIQMQLRRQERAELNARIEALQLRINPHFLFNSMNSIASLIAVDPRAAEQAVEDLCELFRASLKEATQPVPLNQELELCRRYLAIEQLRLGERLTVEWDEADVPASVTIPLLTVQPVLENAVYHGIQPLPEGGTVSIHVRLLKRSLSSILEICITNPVADTRATQNQGFGHNMALNNIRERLAALYEGQASLVCEQTDRSFKTCLHIPMGEG